MVNGQMLVSSVANPTKKRKIAWDIQLWSQAFFMYASALISANSTTKPESAGLLAHIFSVRTAVGKRPGWQPGLLDLRTIFCQCMASQQRVFTYRPTARVRSKRQFSLRDLGMSGMELQESMQKIRMYFLLYSCYFCRGPHKGPTCLSQPSKGCGQ